MKTWLNSLGLRYKLMLMVIPPIFGLLWFSVTAIYDKNQVLLKSAKLASAINLDYKLMDLVHALQVERSATMVLYSASNAKVVGENKMLTSARAESVVKLAEVNAFLDLQQADKTQASKEAEGSLDKALSALTELPRYQQRLDAAVETRENIETFYATTIKQILKDIIHTEGLSTNVGIRNMRIGQARLVMAQERFALLQQMLAAIIGKDQVSQDDVVSINQAIGERNILLESFLGLSIPETQQAYNDLSNSAPYQQAEGIIDKISHGDNAELNKLGVEKWFSISGEQIDSVNMLSQKNLTYILQRVTTLMADAKNELFSAISVALLATLISLYFIISISREFLVSIAGLSAATKKINQGDYAAQIAVVTKDEIGVLGDNFNTMTTTLKQVIAENEKEQWIKTGQSELSSLLSGDQSANDLANKAICYLAKYLHCLVGLIYLCSEEQNSTLKLVGSYAHTKRKNIAAEYSIGESLVGQAALEQQSIVITEPPQDYIKIISGLGEAVPRNIIITPILLNKQVVGVMELGTLQTLTEMELELLNLVTESIAITITAAKNRDKTIVLLEQTQQQATEMEQQQQELEASNKELEAQTVTLKQSQQELEQYNVELKEKTTYLEQQQQEISSSNERLEKAKKELEDKAKDLYMASKYKSEFMANMSHELRTPLNSLLIFAQSLLKNKHNNLKEDQLEAVGIIKSAGYDLLTLINDVLDLSKVEAGKLDIYVEALNLRDIIMALQQQFALQAKEKNLDFKVEVEPGLPEIFNTDKNRLVQILRNLLSNAFKFTEHGMVALKVFAATPMQLQQCSTLKANKPALGFMVQDTGIGIAANKITEIFGAFHQGDGAINRKFGGTGLGLTISREVGALLNGEIVAESTQGSGSKFTFFLQPQNEIVEYSEGNVVKMGFVPTTHEDSKISKLDIDKLKLSDPVVADDRGNIAQNDKSILFIEDDANFAKIIVDLAKQKGYKALTAKDGLTGLALAIKWQPTAIILDIGLTDISGIEVLDQLKQHKNTFHIPVHIVSANDTGTLSAIKGAVGYIVKPAGIDDIEKIFTILEAEANHAVKNILVIEDNRNNQQAICTLLEDKPVTITSVTNGQDALRELTHKRFDCVILDLNLPGMSGFELIKLIANDKRITMPPLVVYTGRTLTREEHKELSQYSCGIVIKGKNAPERLSDEISMFLHQVTKGHDDSSMQKQSAIASTTSPVNEQKTPSNILHNKVVLLVDDDMRNTLALSRALTEEGLKIIAADNGENCLQKIASNPQIDLVLMDIMMPVMDGFQAMQKIRGQDKYKKLPIIALTAKAMPGDKVKCLESGANDYLAKPVDTCVLISMIKVHLHHMANNA